MQINCRSSVAKAIPKMTVLNNCHLCGTLMLNGRSKNKLCIFVLEYLQPRFCNLALQGNIFVIKDGSKLLCD